jgi:hypothetical protein
MYKHHGVTQGSQRERVGELNACFGCGESKRVSKRVTGKKGNINMVSKQKMGNVFRSANTWEHFKKAETKNLRQKQTDERKKKMRIE